MSEVKQVKVDNWGIFFLQRLKHFFNRTDYCDLTLQFQDNAQLKVHRLVLSACTEYFELLERTCEMYEDCLVMPDDLQADVVVPIVNFMYTGQLEFRMDLLERLYQTSLVMNMPVLTKLLDAHRVQPINREIPSHSYSNPKRHKAYDTPKSIPSPSSSYVSNNKRSYGKAFENNTSQQKYKKHITNKSDLDINNMLSQSNITPMEYGSLAQKRQTIAEPRPMRYELPEELESDTLFDNSFTNISYTSKPLMVHPETTKHYSSKKLGIFEDPSSSKRFSYGRSTMDIVECKKISVNDNIFGDDPTESISDDQEIYQPRDTNQLFDQILDNGGPKVTIETKDSKTASNLDHAKIISEVLKKYPHLVKSNKNIKLKILNTPSKKKPRAPNASEEKDAKLKLKPESDYSFETEIVDSKEAAKLIALGAENVKGPWICLICGTPGKALQFVSYYKFRRHLVEVHNEKPVLNICEYCGQKSPKRNYLLHHLYTKHGVEPPPPYHFPKCNSCSYIALTEGFLIKHKLSHSEKQNFRCNVCYATFSTSNQVLIHIQKTGHKYSADRKTNIQCIYCLKVFLRESNLYAHLRTYHKESAKNDGVIDISDDERPENETKGKGKSGKPETFKYEVPVIYKNEYDDDDADADVQYQIQQQSDGNIQVFSKKPRVLLPTAKHKILNPGFTSPSMNVTQKSKPVRSIPSKQNEFLHNTNIAMDNETESEDVVMIDNNEYIVKDNQLIPKKEKALGNECFTIPIHSDIEESAQNVIPATSMEYTNVQTTNTEDHKVIIKKSSGINQPIQIVVSNEEEYKALMSSNHSIIFEDGDAGKTLTVLTTPHRNNTAIDLDSTQSNEMMIIQDQYPLNVSEGMSGENSNIVVVYSHPVDDQNKEYQLITTESIGSQFVTSSGIITQSYETVTTSAPGMSTNELETPVEDSWQNTIPQNIVPAMEMEIPISNNQITTTPMESQQSSIETIHETQLPLENSKTIELHTSTEQVINETTSITEQHDNNFNEANNIMIGDAQPNVINSEQQADYNNTINIAPIENLNKNNLTEEAKESACVPSNDDNKITEDNVSLQNTAAPELPTSPRNNDQDMNTDENCDTETIENIAKAIQSSASEHFNVPNDTEVRTSVVIESVNNRDVSITKAKEEIKNLTSEWSDDEIESSSQDQNTIQEENNSTITKSTESETMDTDSQPEESIENIRNEMENQLNRPLGSMTALDPVVPLAVTEETIRVLEDRSKEEENDEEKESINKPDVPSESNKTVKISSLLTDWDDNDSQEEDAVGPDSASTENKAETEQVEESVPSEEDTQSTSCINVVIEPGTHKVDTKVDDSIKSLVNDWAEDDDEEDVVNKETPE